MFDQLMGLMTLLEGHATHVMDAVGPTVVPSVAAISASFSERRRRSKGPIDRLLRALLGMDMKLAQYVNGAAFVDAVVEQVGMASFNADLDVAGDVADPQRDRRPVGLGRPGARLTVPDPVLRATRGWLADHLRAARAGRRCVFGRCRLTGPRGRLRSRLWDRPAPGRCDRRSPPAAGLRRASRRHRRASSPSSDTPMSGCSRSPSTAPEAWRRPPARPGTRHCGSSPTPWAPADRTPRCCWRIPPTTRPRRCCSGWLAGRGRARSPGCGPGGRPGAGRCSVCAGQTPNGPAGRPA